MPPVPVRACLWDQATTQGWNSLDSQRRDVWTNHTCSRWTNHSLLLCLLAPVSHYHVTMSSSRGSAKAEMVRAGLCLQIHIFYCFKHSWGRVFRSQDTSCNLSHSSLKASVECLLKAACTGTRMGWLAVRPMVSLLKAA